MKGLRTSDGRREEGGAHRVSKVLVLVIVWILMVTHKSCVEGLVLRMAPLRGGATFKRLCLQGGHYRCAFEGDCETPHPLLAPFCSLAVRWVALLCHALLS